MSFILDALKKSENERQRKVGPSLADVHVRPPQSNRPWWAVAIGALLLVNLGVLIVALTRNHDSTPAPPQSAVQSANSAVDPRARASMPVNSGSRTAATSASSTTRSQEHSPPTTNAAVRSLAEEAGVPSGADTESSDAPNPSLAAAALPPAGPPVVRPIEAPAVSPANSAATFSSRNQGSKQADEVLPTASDLIASGTQLPELHLDIHVHSATPADRFVYVNMHKYLEGQTMSEGPVVERITPEGVILNHHGLRFLLPRQ
jgi:general secretion pathway protein B